MRFKEFFNIQDMLNSSEKRLIYVAHVDGVYGFSTGDRDFKVFQVEEEHIPDCWPDPTTHDNSFYDVESFNNMEAASKELYARLDKIVKDHVQSMSNVGLGTPDNDCLAIHRYIMRQFSNIPTKQVWQIAENVDGILIFGVEYDRNALFAHALRPSLESDDDLSNLL
jgi:hypothetical protein